MRYRLKWILPIMVLIALVLVAALLLVNNNQTPVQQPQETTAKVTIARIKLAANVGNVLLYGRVESPRLAKLEAAITADVIQSPVREGQYVSKGQVLIKLDDAEAQFLVQQRQGEVAALKARIAAQKVRFEADKRALVQEKNLVMLAQRDVDRQAQLRRTDSVSKAALDRAKESLHQRELSFVERQRAVDDYQNQLNDLQAQLKRAQAQLGQAKLDLSRTVIRAPFNGLVAKLDVSVGNRVTTNETLLEIYDTTDIEIRAQIPGQYVNPLRQSLLTKQSIKAITVGQYPGIEARLMRLASIVRAGRSGVEGLFKLVQENRQLPVGATVEMLVDLPPQINTALIPSTALYNLNRIYLLQDDRLKALRVERVGSKTDTAGNAKVIIKSTALHDGQVYITNQLPNAITGLKVKIGQ